MNETNFQLTSPDVNPQVNRFVRRPETNALIDYLQSLAVGETATFAAMTEVLSGQDSQVKHRHIVMSALDVLERDQGVFFKAVPDVGYVRLSHDEAVSFVRDRHKKRFKSDTNRFRSRIESIDPAKLLDSKSRQDYSMATAELSLREIACSQKTEGMLRQHVANKPAQSIGVDKKSAENMIKGFLQAGVKG